MPLNIDQEGAVRVLTLDGKIMTTEALDLKPQFDAYLGGSPGPTLVDMSRVRYFSSYLVGLLIALRSGLAERNFPIHFAGLDPKHRLVFKVSGLEDLFQYHETRAAGVSALSASAPG